MNLEVIVVVKKYLFLVWRSQGVDGGSRQAARGCSMAARLVLGRKFSPGCCLRSLRPLVVPFVGSFVNRSNIWVPLFPRWCRGCISSGSTQLSLSPFLSLPAVLPLFSHFQRSICVVIALHFRFPVWFTHLHLRSFSRNVELYISLKSIRYTRLSISDRHIWRPEVFKPFSLEISLFFSLRFRSEFRCWLS